VSRTPSHTPPADVELCDARARGRHVDELGDRVEADGDRHEPDAVPEEELPEGVALRARHRVEPDRGEPQAEPAGQEALQQRLAAQRGDEGDAEQGQHEELRRAEREDQRSYDGNGEPEHEGAEHRADERAHHRRAERASGLAVLGHRVPVHDRGGGGGLARNAEQDRRDVAGGGGDREHAQEEG
jgi:hypothetical protein